MLHDAILALFRLEHLFVKLETWLALPKIFVFPDRGEFFEHDAPKGSAIVQLSPNDRHALFTRKINTMRSRWGSMGRCRRGFISCTVCHEGILHINDD